MLKRLCTLVFVILASVSPLAPAALEKKILLLGDSLGASYGVPVEQGWARQLDERLRTLDHPARLINASISGDTTAGGLARLEALLQSEKPDLVLIELGGNDGLRGLNINAMKSNLVEMIRLSRQYHANLVLIGIKIPPNYGSRYRDRFEQTFVEVSTQENVPLLPFLLDGVGGIEGYMQDDRIHPNADAQPVISDNVWRFLKPLLDGGSAAR